MFAASTSSGDATATTTPLSLIASIAFANSLKSSNLKKIKRIIIISYNAEQYANIVKKIFWVVPRR